MKFLVAIVLWIFIVAALIAFIRGAGQTKTRERR
jgi:hypothetical protein